MAVHLHRSVYRILAALLICIALAACADTDSGKKEYDVTRVSVILPHNDDGYWSNVIAGLYDGIEEYGEAYHLDVQISIPQLNYSIPQMTDLLRQQIAAQVDMIVIQGNEDEEFQAVLEDAQGAGILILCIDTQMEDFPYDIYIGSDNYAAGRLIGEELALLTEGACSVVVISGEEDYLNLEQRLEGFKDVIAEYPEIHLVDLLYDEYDGLTFLKYYDEYASEADALVCLEGTGGLAIYNQMNSRGDNYEVIVGFDATEAIPAGLIDGVVAQEEREMGRRMIGEIADYVSEGHFSSQEIYTDILWLTADNYDEVMGE